MWELENILETPCDTMCDVKHGKTIKVPSGVSVASGENHLTIAGDVPVIFNDQRVNMLNANLMLTYKYMSN
jgi:hypothetical protein